jgi:hypothetical protein
MGRFRNLLVADNFIAEHPGDQDHAETSGHSELHADTEVESAHRVPRVVVRCVY